MQTWQRIWHVFPPCVLMIAGAAGGASTNENRPFSQKINFDSSWWCASGWSSWSLFPLLRERERERGRRTSLALRGMQGGCTWQEVKSKALLVAVVQRLQACTGVSTNVVTCFNYKQQNTRKTVTVVLWSCVHLSADWTQLESCWCQSACGSPESQPGLENTDWAGHSSHTLKYVCPLSELAAVNEPITAAPPLLYKLWTCVCSLYVRMMLLQFSESGQSSSRFISVTHTYTH